MTKRRDFRRVRKKKQEGIRTALNPSTRKEKTRKDRQTDPNDTMDVRSLTLRNRNRSQRRPQISAPRPIADPKASSSSSSAAAAAAPRPPPGDEDNPRGGGGGGGPNRPPQQPQQSQPQQQQQHRPPRQEPQQQQQQPQPQPQQELPHGGATSDLVKRRYSIRYNQGQVPAFDPDAPPVPSIPAVPSVFTTFDNEPPASGPGAGAGGAALPLRVDPKALKDPKLPVENCTSNTCCFTFNT